MTGKGLQQFCSWLEQTQVSQTIQATAWIVPAVQTVHILAISALMAAALMLNLRLLKIVGREQPLRPCSERYLPIIWWALPVLLVTGILMIVGEPVRSLENAIFQLKMLLVLSAIAVTIALQRPLQRDASFWDTRRGVAVSLALLSMALWVGIVFAGRWIAYF
jgi:hypothetical protein